MVCSGKQQCSSSGQSRRLQSSGIKYVDITVHRALLECGFKFVNSRSSIQVDLKFLPDAAASTHDQDPEDQPAKQTISLVRDFNQDAFLSNPKAPDNGDHVPVLYLAELSPHLAFRDSDGWDDPPDADTIHNWQNGITGLSCPKPLTVVSYFMYITDNPVAIDVQTFTSTSFVIVKAKIRAFQKRFILNSGWSSVSSRLQPSRS